MHVQQTEGVRGSPCNEAPEKAQHSGLWEYMVKNHNLGGEIYQAQKLLPRTVTGGVGSTYGCNIDVVGQRAVYLVGHQMDPSRPLQGPIYSCVETYFQWYVP